MRAFLQNNYFVAEVPLPDAVLLTVRQHGLRARGQPLLAEFLPDVWWLPYAALSLPFLLLFRLTCYYYRGAYYRIGVAVPDRLRGGRAARELHRRDPASR